MCNEAEPGSLTLRLTGSPDRGFDVRIAPSVARRTTCRTSNLHGDLLTDHKISQAWPGAPDDTESLAALHRAVDLGVNFIDTADVYGDGRSERLIARLRKERREPLVVATKAGRRLSPHTEDGIQCREPREVHRPQAAEFGNRLPRPGATPLSAG